MKYFDHGRVRDVKDALAERLALVPDWAVVLGSGLGGFCDGMTERSEVPYGEIDGLPVSGAAGHAGKFVAGRLGTKNVVAMQGRVHIYEGYSAFETALSVAALGELGVKNVILTNAAGAVNPKFTPGSVMAIRDHINLLADSPLTGLEGTARFVDMSAAYDPEIVEYLKSAFGVEPGVYAAMRGPQYETPAEVNFAKIAGADAVGMSTVSEAIMARYYEMRVAGLSMISNMAAGISGAPLSHEEVLETGRASGERVRKILTGIVEKF